MGRIGQARAIPTPLYSRQFLHKKLSDKHNFGVPVTHDLTLYQLPLLPAVKAACLVKA